MHFSQPDGKILINSKNGCTKMVNGTELNDYILIDAEVCKANTPRDYNTNEDPDTAKSTKIYINKYSDAISEFEDIEF